MTQFQKFLLLVFAVLAVAVLGRVAWSLILPSISYAGHSIASLLSVVPGWGWWIVFGVAMSFLCPLKAALFGRGCRSSSRCASRRSAVNA